MKYQVISTGKLQAGFEKKESVARIQQLTRLSKEQVRKSLLDGRPKTLLSSDALLNSDDKEKVRKVALALSKAGLEVKVEVRQAAVEALTDEPGDIVITPRNKKTIRLKERIDSFPPSVAPVKRKVHYGRYLVYLFLLILACGAGYGWYPAG